MPLRAIGYHLDKIENGRLEKGKLETVTVICSEDSITQVNLFLTICKQYNHLKEVSIYLLAKKDGYPDLVSLPSATDIGLFQGYDFEDFDEIVEAMDSLLREFKAKGYAEKDIMIDITGGQKPTSIVGAAMTFNLKRKAQYVQTNHPWDVRSYDVVLSPSATKGLGI